MVTLFSDSQVHDMFFKKLKAAITISEKIGRYMCKRFKFETQNKNQLSAFLLT